MIQIDTENLAIKVQYTLEWADCEEMYDELSTYPPKNYNNPPSSSQLTRGQKLTILGCILRVYVEENKYAESCQDIWSCRMEGIIRWLEEYYGK